MDLQLTDRRFANSVLRLAFPIAMHQLMLSGFQFIDMAMIVGLGNADTAAVGIAGRWTFLMGLAYFGFSSGTAAFVSQYWGAGDMVSIRRTYGFAMANVLLLALAYTLLAVLAPEPMMRLYTGEEAVVRAGSAYVRIASLGAMATAWVSVTGATLRATERVYLPFATGGAAAALNTLLSYALIYGRLGMPTLGISGAGIATAVSAWFHAALLTALSFGSRGRAAAPLRLLAGWNRAFVGRFYRVALPVVGNEVFWGIGNNIYSMVLARQGSEGFAAFTVFSYVEQLSFVPFIGLCMACAIMVGKAVGAGRMDLGWRWAGRFAWIFPALSAVCGALIIVSRRPLVGLLSIETEGARETAAALLLIYGLWIAVRMINYLMVVGIFRAGGDTRAGFYIDTVCVFALGVPVTCILGLTANLPFHRLFLAMYLSEDVVKAALCLLYFRSRRWIRRLAVQYPDMPAAPRELKED